MTFQTPEPKLDLHTTEEWVDRFYASLLPLPGPAELQTEVSQLMLELQMEKLHNAEIQQQLEQ